MAGLAAVPFDRARLARIADALMVAVAVALPWSTSATGILLVVWLLALIPALDWQEVRAALLTPAGGLPVLLVAFAVLGMGWADVSLAARWDGLDGYVKLLAIPLVMTQFRRSDNGMRVFLGFLAACGALLIASWTVAIWPRFPIGANSFGVPVKNYIVQSLEFAICAAGLLHLAVEAARARRWARMALLLIPALAFLQDIFFVATGRTTLVVIPVLLVVYGTRYFGAKGFFGAVLLGLIAAAVVWMSSPYVRYRVAEVLTATERPASMRHVTSSEERMVFWTKSLRFIASAPMIGHGTGSITEMFKRAAVGKVGPAAEIAANPHNQTFAVAIQLGLIGAALLWLMWLFHFLLFRGAGLVTWIGLVVVTQNVVGSLFNSFLFDYTEGWLYVVGFGVAAGMVLRERDALRAKDSVTVPET
jgi:O-antigen ligase